MAINIKFENEFEKLITFKQANYIDNYHKVFEENGIVKRKEEYKNNILVKVIYYLENTDTEQQAISKILNNYLNLSEGFEIRKVENIGIYRKELRRFFSSTGIYDNFQEIVLFNQQDLLIYEKEEETINGIVYYDTKKYYYGQTSKENYEFAYNQNGQLLSMRGIDPPFVAENDYSITFEEIEFFFPGFLSNNLYYINANILP
ncbi:hypothetical protein [Chryseobacterium sp. LAM-KRS1]|uniref:hypothetical protein n=1 Tax=Chryseobacterium sp. LAM-KRS1 TaxID=2715754 RepID=UPI001552F5B1|nr:hypothetical protein [Chryseobacterium sp. LAM-KRS1]